jgi:group I intron endonuclease
MKISGVYQIQSKIKPERIYIGSSVCIGNRWNLHLSRLRRNKHDNIKLQNHFNKYGEADLIFSILLGCEKEDLIKTEQYFIDSYKPHFNIALIAKCPMLGRKTSEETKRKISESNKGCKPWNKGISPSVEIRNKISKALTGRVKSIEERKNISKGQLGIKKPKTEEQKKRISARQLGRKHSQVTKDKMSESAKKRINKPRIYTEEYRKLLSEYGRKGGFAKSMNQFIKLN